MKWLNETILKGNFVRLEPMKEQDQEAIVKAASDGELWNLWYTSVPSSSNIKQYVEFAINEYEADRSLPFVVIDNETNQVIGSTRYCNATPAHRRVEIGYTWYGKSHQRTGVNTECKHLLLSHAFEILDCIAVEFRTSFHNLPSKNAIARLGAKQDGILRNHTMDAEGILRDTVVFSILRDEWKAVKKSLEFKMNK